MGASHPNSWRAAVVGWAFALLVAAVVLRLTVGILRTIEPYLIVGASVLVVVYVIYLVHRFRQSRW